MPTHIRITRLLYLFLLPLLFYLLFTLRSGEVYTVWEVMHPLFMPFFFATTFLLLFIIFSPEKLEYKLLFTIFHSILSHTFFVIIFPAGNVGVQQMILGRTRLVFDNIVPYGYSPTSDFLGQIYLWCRESFQPSFSVLFARMFGVDVYWTHLLLIPLLWGAFIPLVSFMIAKELGQNENVSVLSSLLVSIFPTTILWGANSFPIGLGYIFFFCSLYFFLKHLSSKESRSFFSILTFSIVSFLSHFLTGIMSFSLLILAIASKKYHSEKARSPLASRFLLWFSFIFCISLLPFALIYHKFFYPINTYFSLEKLNGLSITEIVGQAIFGGYLKFDIQTAIIFGIGPLLGFLGMIHYLRNSAKQRLNKNSQICAFFLLIGFLMFLIQYRILKLFMVGVPFEEERLWVFRDFIATPFVAILTGAIIFSLLKKISNTLSGMRFSFSTKPSINVRASSLATYAIIFVLLSSWVTASIYYAYPHYGPLQTTSYELEAVKHIDETTKERYIVIGDQWIIYAGVMFVGINNPRAYYFSHMDPQGASLFLKMKSNPTNETLMEAMEINNATTAYFIIEKPRLGTEEYNRIIQQAQQNKLQTYQIFHYKDEEKLHIFYYQKIS